MIDKVYEMSWYKGIAQKKNRLEQVTVRLDSWQKDMLQQMDNKSDFIRRAIIREMVRKPLFHSFCKISKDGKNLITGFVITSIYPMKQIKKLLEGKIKVIRK